ncbi:MAG: hypothetical protein ACI87E_002030 [Mariniblastus sp.]|jgi:hypothetical protein
MPRSLRSDIDGLIYHALNRGSVSDDIFPKDGDHEAFEPVISERPEKAPGASGCSSTGSKLSRLDPSLQVDKAISGFYDRGHDSYAAVPRSSQGDDTVHVYRS